MAEPRIDVDGLPFGVSGPYDTVVGVDEATGAARRFPMPQPGTPRSYATLASLPAASGFTEGYTVWVNNDPTPANNGTWAVLGGVWVQSADRVTGLEGKIADIGNRVAPGPDATITHAFTDAEGRLLAHINAAGEMDFHPTPEAANRASHLKKDDGTHVIFGVLDGEQKMVFGVMSDGSLVGGVASGGGSSVQDGPVLSPDSTVQVAGFSRVIQKMAVNTNAIGRTTDPVVQVNGDGLTHPKMIYIPGGWNGYRYWLAATPTFGVINDVAYENPHVWASNDLVSWVEPSGGPLDLPEDGNPSYWSDTHLALDDDGWLYCFYRGTEFSFSSRCIVYRRTRDGVTWSSREMLYDSSAPGATVNRFGGIVSPSIFKSGGRWQYIDIVTDTPHFPVPPSNYATTKAVFRRSGDHVTRGYEDYSLDQAVNYDSRPWGAGDDPWHIDALAVGNLHLHLINSGPIGGSTGDSLYLAWSADGWNFKILPMLPIDVNNAYRSSLTLRSVVGSTLSFHVVVARKNGTMDLYDMTLEIN